MKWKELNKNQKSDYLKGRFIDIGLLVIGWAIIIPYQMLPTLELFQRTVTTDVVSLLQTDYEFGLYAVYAIFGIMGLFLSWWWFSSWLATFINKKYNFPLDLKSIT